ncbi:MAG: DUF547 domain-containing protein [Bacteroidetes bacterium]|nr:MAG: DUF547 domain-containing protein [Bacteroidota bacterium]
MSPPSIVLRFLVLLGLLVSCQASPADTQQSDAHPKPPAADTVTKLTEKTTQHTAPLEPPVPVEKPALRTATVSSKAATPSTTSGAKSAATPPAKPAMRTSGPAPLRPEVASTEPASVVRPNHQSWDALLRTYVSSSGRVDYRRWQADMDQLDTYLETLSQQAPQKDWPAAEVKAYWINAYNAFTVKLVLENYPLQSIRDLDGGNPWDRKWIEIGDNTYSLNQIEHQILRPRFRDARIHFAINCAAASCPPLFNRAFTASNTERLLTQLTEAFINNPVYNTITEEQAEVSKIFEWYAEDFGDLRSYLNQYSRTNIGPDTPITFKAYDWALNA